MPTLTNRIAIVTLFLMISFMLIGCGSGGKTTVRGRIITGTVGQAVAVGSSDERLKEDGLAGLDVAVLSKGGSVARGRGVYANVTSDEMGDFELVFPSGTFPSDVVVIQVSGDGIFTARSSTYMPTSGGSLLCIVIPRPGYVEPEQNRTGDQ
jgi:GTPase SAR1 family protein